MNIIITKQQRQIDGYASRSRENKLTEELVSMKDLVIQLKNDNKSKQSELKVLQRQLDNGSKDNNDMNKKTKSLAQENTRLTEEMSKIKTQLQTMNLEVANKKALENERDSLNKIIAGKDQKISKLTKDIEKLSQDLRTISTASKKLSKENEMKDIEINRLKKLSERGGNEGGKKGGNSNNKDGNNNNNANGTTKNYKELATVYYILLLLLLFLFFIYLFIIYY